MISGCFLRLCGALGGLTEVLRYLATFGLVVIASALGLSQALAGGGIFEDGNGLNELCNGPPVGRIVLRGYAMAIADYQSVQVGIVDSATGAVVMPRVFICLPDNVKASQVEDLTCNYLAAHPENRQLPGIAMVINALVAAWPCPKK
ncbi:hypothetical protein X760_27820 [Mesorhizobium sp. LSHC422A00]|nr:hypothetical protein X760_27820 [Mesorhizobium sp. LSHC422A00]